MAGFMDKIKGMFGGSKGEAGTSTPSPKVESLEETAAEVKDQVDVLVDKAGENVPDEVKETFEKVSDKVETIIPGHTDSDAGDAVGAVVDADETALAESPYMPDEVADAGDAVTDAAGDATDAGTDAASDAQDAVTD